MNMRRGHESRQHLEAKTVIASLFNTPVWSVFPEQRDTDVLVMHNPTGFLTAIEAESSPRNVARNIMRDFTNGCHAVAVVALTGRYFSQIKNKAVQCSGNIRVFRFTEPDQVELRNWTGHLAENGERP